MLRIFVSIFLFVTFSNSFAQKTVHRFDHLTIENGLSKNYSKTILQDSYGFMWIATTNGLNRYDGYSIKIYRNNINDSTSISGNTINCIFEDSKKRLWIGTNYGGLNLFNWQTDNFTSFNFQKRPKYTPDDDVITVISEEKNGDLVIGTRNGLVVFDPESGNYDRYLPHPEKKTTLSENNISALIIDTNNKVWLGTSNSNALSKFDIVDKSFQSFINKKTNTYSNSNITTLCKDSNNKLWIGSNETGLSLFNITSERFEDIRLSQTKVNLSGLNRIWHITVDSNGKIWVGSMNNGVFSINPTNYEVENILPLKTNKFGLSSPSISYCFEDKNKNMWFCTLGGGINILKKDKNNFEYHTHTNSVSGLSNNFVSCFYEDDNKNIWIGTDGGALNKYNPTTNNFKRYNYKNGLSSNIILDIAEGPDKQLWLATWDDGLNLFNPRNGKTKHYSNTRSKNSISYIQLKDVATIQDKLYIATHGDGINIYDYNKNIFINKSNSPKLAKQLYAPQFGNKILEDYKGRIWIATNRGLFQFYGENYKSYLYNHSVSNSLTNNSVVTIFQDSRNQLWIGTRKGLNLYNEEKDNFTNINDICVLPEQIKAILEDKKGNLWISSNSCITKLNPISLISINFTSSDGLQGNDFYDRSCLLASTGKMYFGGVNGFTAFYPDSIKTDNVELIPYITELRVENIIITPNDESGILNKHIMFCDQLTLPYNKSTFTISFASLDIDNSHRLQYAYKLENLDNEWTFVEDNNKAHYTSLNPGTYFLKIKSGSGDINDIQNMKTLKVIITPPIWERLWFRITFFVLVTLFIFYLVKRRIYNIEKQKLILEKEVNERTAKIEYQRNKLSNQTERLYEQNLILIEQQEELSGTYAELQIQSGELKIANSELIKINETKNKLFSLIAHDLKDPIGSIFSFSSLLGQDFNNLSEEEIKDYIEIIQESSHTTLNMFQNLLQWARSQTEMVQYKPEPVNLKEILLQVIDFQKLSATNKKIQIANRVKKDLWIYADENMLLSVFRNLINNAIKFTHEGGAIILQADIIETEILVSVKDTGIGMTPKRVKTILDKEEQISDKGTGGERGVGLGLTICKEFIEHHEGRMLLESDLGKGTTVIVALPNKTVENKDIVKAHSLNSNINDINIHDNNILKDKLILVIDDSANTRQAIKHIFRKKCEIIEAKDGQRGIELATQKMPDLIISDIVMPNKNGIDLCKTLKNNNYTNFIPIILLTANDSETFKLDAYSAGADEFIVKPFKPELLESRIVNLLNKQESIKQAIRDNIAFEDEESSDDNPNRQFVLKIQEITDEHMNDSEFSVEYLATQLGYSRYQFFRKFKAIIGQTPIEYLLNYRLQKSEYLLRKGDMRVSEVAYETGFSNPKYFATTFRKKYGMSPSEYMGKKQAAE